VSNRFAISVLALVALMFLPGRVAAQTKTCDALRSAQREVAQAVLSSQHPYDCCDDTIAACLRKKPVCKLVERLADDVCRRAAAGKSRAEIERELERRAASTMGSKHSIDLGGAAVAGDPGAKATIVVYACARCPFCARLVPALHQSVTSGRLQGKAKLYLRPFPIRNHANSTVAAMALMAANQLGRFWDMVLYLYSNFDRFDPAKLPDWAASVGLDREKFRALLDDPALREKLAGSKKEGVRNKVEVTPTIFIDGRRYQASLDRETIEDFVEERLEQAAR
jgi:protein-disulfide isomerase